MTLNEFKKILTEIRKLQSGLLTPNIKNLEVSDKLDLLLFLVPDQGEAARKFRDNLCTNLIESSQNSSDGLKRLYHTFVQIGMNKEALKILDL